MGSLESANNRSIPIIREQNEYALPSIVADLVLLARFLQLYSVEVSALLKGLDDCQPDSETLAAIAATDLPKKKRSRKAEPKNSAEIYEIRRSAYNRIQKLLNRPDYHN